MASTYSVVISKQGKELYRSQPMTFEKALEKAKQIGRYNQDRTWNAESVYVEEAHTVKHLPVQNI